MIHSELVRGLLAKHGECRSQSASAWTGDFELPVEIANFYREIGPLDVNIEGFGNSTYMPSLAKLWELQAGYRYHPTSKQRFSEWNENWIVIAEEGGDPYIFCDGKILLAMHGMGVWEPGEIFPNLNAMAACLATIGTVVVEAGLNLADNEAKIRPEYRQRAIADLTQYLENEQAAESLLADVGWG